MFFFCGYVHSGSFSFYIFLRSVSKSLSANIVCTAFSISENSTSSTVYFLLQYELMTCFKATQMVFFFLCPKAVAAINLKYLDMVVKNTTPKKFIRSTERVMTRFSTKESVSSICTCFGFCLIVFPFIAPKSYPYIFSAFLKFVTVRGLFRSFPFFTISSYDSFDDLPIMT